MILSQYRGVVFLLENLRDIFVFGNCLVSYINNLSVYVVTLPACEGKGILLSVSVKGKLKDEWVVQTHF